MDDEYRKLFRLSFPSDCTDLIDEFAYVSHPTFPYITSELKAVFINTINAPANYGGYSYQHNYSLFNFKSPQMQYGIIKKVSVGQFRLGPGPGGIGYAITFSPLNLQMGYSLVCDGKVHPIRITENPIASFSSGDPSNMVDSNVIIFAGSDFQINFSLLDNNPDYNVGEFHVFIRVTGWFFQ